jgi:hypothetical protein
MLTYLSFKTFWKSHICYICGEEINDSFFATIMDIKYLWFFLRYNSKHTDLCKKCFKFKNGITIDVPHKKKLILEINVAKALFNILDNRFKKK